MRILFFIFLFLNILFASENALVDVQKNGNSLCFEFENNIDRSEVKTFSSWFKNVFAYVIDVKAIRQTNTTMIKNFQIMLTKISQFDKDTTRIVLQDPKEFQVGLDYKNRSICVDIQKKDIQKNTTNRSKQENKNKVSINRSRRTIFIDPGHGGKDPGSISNSYKEKDIVLDISKKIASVLSSRGYNVKFTRNSDIFVNLKNRTSMANRADGDLFISIHLNAAPNKKMNHFCGLETYFLSPNNSQRSLDTLKHENSGDLEDMNYFSKQTFLNFINKEKIIFSNKLAIDLQKNILFNVKKRFPIKDGGVKEGPFWVLVGAQMPAVLIEVGYITNQNELNMLLNKNFQNSFAQGVANGIDAYFAKNR